MQTLKPHTAIVGIGNPHRTDDGVGIVCSQMLAACEWCTSDRFDCVVNHGEITQLFELLSDYERVLIIDAANLPHLPVGSLRHIHYHPESEYLIQQLQCSTHVLDISQILALATAVGQLNAKVEIFAIAAQDFSFGEKLTSAMQASIYTIINKIGEFLQKETTHA